MAQKVLSALYLSLWQGCLFCYFENIGYWIRREGLEVHKASETWTTCMSLGSEKMKMQATMATAYSHEHAKTSWVNSQKAGKVWDDDDFQNLKLNHYCSETILEQIKPSSIRLFWAWKEKWEMVKFSSKGDQRHKARLQLSMVVNNMLILTRITKLGHCPTIVIYYTRCRIKHSGRRGCGMSIICWLCMRGFIQKLISHNRQTTCQCFGKGV